VVVLCVSPTGSQIEQTVSTLRFGLNVKKICNKVKSNSYETKNFEALQKLLKDYEVRIKHLEIEKLKEKNQSEELIEMIKRQALHKKELTEKILSLENRVPTEVRAELRETLLERSHEKEGLARILSQSIDQESPLKQAGMGQELERECRQLRRANNHFIYKISKMRAQAANKSKGSPGIEDLMREFFSGSTVFPCLEDKSLQKFKEKFVSAIQTIDEQLITRRIHRRLNGVLRDSMVETREAEPEEVCGLGKRASQPGLLCPQSVKMILDKSSLAPPTLYKDSLLPGILERYLREEQQVAILQPEIDEGLAALEPGELAEGADIIEVEDDSEEEEVEEVGGCHGELSFNLGHLRGYIYRPPGVQATQLIQTREDCRRYEPEILTGVGGAGSLRAEERAQGEQRFERRQGSDGCGGSETRGGNIFQTGLSIERRPLLELSNKRSEQVRFASPKSQDTSLYYFTSKKNDFEFSFDRTTMLVEKNLALQYSRGKAAGQMVGKEN
jgi:hypothetical protein